MGASEGRIEQRAQNWYRERDCALDEFIELLEADDNRPTRYAAEVTQRIPIYDCRQLEGITRDASQRAQLQAEWARVFHDGAGVLVLRQAFVDTRPVDDATAVFESIIRSEREQGSGGADHFAKAGANDRVWNAQEKLCLRAPAVFTEYFSNPSAHACVGSVAWTVLSDDVTGQRGAPRRCCSRGTSRLPSWLPDG